MGKKKGYYVSELYFKPEENTNNIEKPESFTVKDYDAIVDEVVNEQPSQQLNADPKNPPQKDGIDNDISSDVHQTDTQEIEVEFYDLDNDNDVMNEQSSEQLNADPIKDEIDGTISKDVHKTDNQDILNGVASEQPMQQLNTDSKKDGVDGDFSSDPLPTDTKDLTITNEVVNDQPSEQLNEDPVEEELDDDDSSSDSHHTDTQAVISGTNAIEPVSCKKLTEDDNHMKKDANSQSTAIIDDDAKSNLDNGASKKQASATESSNLKASEKFTSIELGEVKHAPKDSPAIGWFKRNRYFVIGIVIIVVVIIVISIAASSRKKPTFPPTSPTINGIPLSTTTEFAAPRKLTLPPGVNPATDLIDDTEDFNNTKTSSIAPVLEATPNETTTHVGINGNTIAASDSTTDVSSTEKTTDEDDYGSGGGDSPSASLSLFENV